MMNEMGLTNRQQMVATLVCDGLSNKMVARRLGLSEGTVKAHIINIFNKVGVRGRGALMVLYHEKRADKRGASSSASDYLALG
jgi:DNA-binding NarL/FixJ family response regulator